MRANRTSKNQTYVFIFRTCPFSVPRCLVHGGLLDATLISWTEDDIREYKRQIHGRTDPMCQWLHAIDLHLWICPK